MASEIFYLAFNILGLAILIGAIYLLLRPMVSGAIYFPTKDAGIKVILELLAVKPGERAADLGSGDGRIVMALAQAGAQAHGYEINPVLVKLSRQNIKKAGLEKNALIHWQSFWKVNLSDFDIIAIYGFPTIMRRLEKKLKKEIKPGARVISNIYPLPGWKHDKFEKGIYLYIGK